MTLSHLKTQKHEKLVPYIEDTPSLMEIRKNDHIQICQTQDVESQADLFAKIRFIPEALPEFHFSDVETSQSFLNNTFKLPILITGMTGGVEKGQEINEALALAAQSLQIPMGLGSQKMLLKDDKYQKLFNVRKVAPNVFLIGNLGAVSLNYGVTLSDIQKLIDNLELNAFALHLNALQECIQPEGERNFSNLLSKIEQIAKNISVPLIIKEVGSGIAPTTLKKLIEAGVSAVDIGGMGGTSWGYIEGLRSNSHGKRLGALFKNWGLATDESLIACTKLKNTLNSNIPLIATGGIRNGVHVAKAVSLGATMVGIGLPLFRAALSPLKGETPQDAVERELAFFQDALSITMFCTGARKLSDLSSRIVWASP